MGTCPAYKLRTAPMAPFPVGWVWNAPAPRGIEDAGHCKKIATCSTIKEIYWDILPALFGTAV